MTGRIFEEPGESYEPQTRAGGARVLPEDPYEARLMLEVDRRREELGARAEALGRTLKATFDPRERVRRHPATGLLASVATGLAFGFLPSLRRPDPPSSERSSGGSRFSPLSIAGDVLKSFGPPFLSSLLSGFLRRR